VTVRILLPPVTPAGSYVAAVDGQLTVIDKPIKGRCWGLQWCCDCNDCKDLTLTARVAYCRCDRPVPDNDLCVKCGRTIAG
jgi:hypothetical protein